MTATIIAFPIDRCRPSFTLAELEERKSFDRASADWAAAPWRGDTGETMMRLCNEGSSADMRHPAGESLTDNCNIAVEHDGCG